MRARDFIVERELNMTPKEPDFDVIDNPFPRSVIQQVVWHGTNAKIEKFERAASGFYISRWEDYSAAYYGTPIPLYVDLRNIYDGGYYDPIVDAAFDMNYKKLAQELPKLGKKGYDAVEMYGDGDSLILIGDVPIVHAVTGKQM